MPDRMQMIHSYCSCCLASSGGVCGGGGPPSSNDARMKSLFYIWLLLHFPHGMVMFLMSLQLNETENWILIKITLEILHQK